MYVWLIVMGRQHKIAVVAIIDACIKHFKTAQKQVPRLVFKDDIASEKNPKEAIHFLKAISSAWLISSQLHKDRVFLCHFGLSKPVSFGFGGGRSHKLQYKVGHYKTIVNIKV